jgi:hypothetical protein
MDQEVSIEKSNKEVCLWVLGMGEQALMMSDEEALELSNALREAVQQDRFREDMVFAGKKKP